MLLRCKLLFTRLLEFLLFQGAIELVFCSFSPPKLLWCLIFNIRLCVSALNVISCIWHFKSNTYFYFITWQCFFRNIFHGKIFGMNLEKARLPSIPATSWTKSSCCLLCCGTSWLMALLFLCFSILNSVQLSQPVFQCSLSTDLEAQFIRKLWAPSDSGFPWPL